MKSNATSRMVVRHAQGIMTGLPGDAARTGGDIAIDDDRITEIGHIEARRGDLDIDATGCVVYPGLISTHHHLFQSVLKAIPAGMNAELTEWLYEVPYKFGARLDEETFRTSVELGMVELLLSGVTTIADHHYLFDQPDRYDAADILFGIAARLGPRFVLCRGGATLAGRLDLKTEKAVIAETCAEILASVSDLKARYHDYSRAALRRVALAPTNLLWSVGPDHIRELATGARSLAVRLHSHLSESAGDVTECLKRHGVRPVEYAARCGFLGEDAWLAHLVHVDQRELAILADTGTAMAHCPQSNCRLGVGIAPAPQLAARGGCVSLGVDGAGSNESCDMISEMHTAWQLHRAVGGPQAVTLEDVIQWATAGGADALGIPQTGRLAVGMQADLGVFDLSHPRYAGLHDRLAGPLLCGAGATVRHLLVSGRPIVRNGQVLGADCGALRESAERVTAKLMENMSAMPA